MKRTTDLKEKIVKRRKNSVSESGHAKNVANFEALISCCNGFDKNYKPSKSAIQLPQLKNLFTNAQKELQSVTVAKSALDIVINNRKIIFSNLKKLSTRVVNALKATDATSQTVDDANAVNRKIQGKRASATATPVREGGRRNSVFQQSFDSLTDNFAKLIETVSAEALYKPNESDIQVASLIALLVNMKTANSAVINANTAYTNAIIARDQVFYEDGMGLKDIAASVKVYVKSLFGKTSPQYGQLVKLKFTKPR